MSNPENRKNFHETQNVFSGFIKERGGIDFLVNNAEINLDQSFALMSAENWSLVTQTNLGGTFHCSRADDRLIAKGRIMQSFDENS